MKVQQELMRHASIQTTMNIYGQAMSLSKREADGKIVEMLLKSKGDELANSEDLRMGVSGSESYSLAMQTGI